MLPRRRLVLEVKAGAIETRIAIDDQTQMNWVGFIRRTGSGCVEKSYAHRAQRRCRGSRRARSETLVSSLVDFASPPGQGRQCDGWDAGAKLGIAITGANTSNGTWWFSTNDGATWSTLGVSEREW